MNAYEKSIQDSLENIQIEPDEILRYRLMLGIKSGAVGLREVKRKIPVRAAVFAAVIAGLIFTTAFSYRNEIVSIINQVIFGNSTAAQVEYTDIMSSGSWGVKNREDLPDAKDYPLGMFDTLEEARLAAPFPIMVPSYLPDNVTGLYSVGVWRVEDPDNPWMHFVEVNYTIRLKNNGESGLMLRQVYAGPDAYFEIKQVFPIEIDKVMVGDAEAVLISAPERFPNNDGTVRINYDLIGYSLNWINDGIAYELRADYHDYYTPEIMIKIAESIS